jgi:uncharacterized protein (DUF2147 family)
MKRLWIAIAILVVTAPAHAEGVLGQWLTPVGATAEVYRCNANVCVKLVALTKDAPSRIDSNNPNASLRKRSLCGLQMGGGFHLTGGTQADGGWLYDPKVGKTYSGSMVSDGDSLKLRGYIGIKLFGRSEVWKRVHNNISTCKE